MASKLAVSFIFLFIASMCLSVQMSAEHAHLIFSSYVKEDWIINGFAAISLVFGLAILLDAVKSKFTSSSYAKSKVNYK